VSKNIKQAEQLKKDRSKNLPTYSIKDILEGDTDSDDEVYDPMNQFPWF
jgi:hypothetical protein